MAIKGSIAKEERVSTEKIAKRKQISFLLFEEAISTGAGYVSMKTLRDAGYDSQEVA
jgi:hypothetical protein